MVRVTLEDIKQAVREAYADQLGVSPQDAYDTLLAFVFSELDATVDEEGNPVDDALDTLEWIAVDIDAMIHAVERLGHGGDRDAGT